MSQGRSVPQRHGGKVGGRQESREREARREGGEEGERGKERERGGRREREGERLGHPSPIEGASDELLL